MTPSLTVELGERSYPIHIGSGLSSRLGEILAPQLQGRQVALVTDENLAATALPAVQAALAPLARNLSTHILPAGEGSKSFATLEKLTTALLQEKPDRKTTLVALGGGVMGDLTGFAAAILLRGIPFIQLPTSLLAMVDSSVGGKTGINAGQGKNLIGSFHQPQAVIIDTDWLTSLPERHWKAGYAEIVKYGVINQPDFFAWLETNHHALLGGDKDLLAQAITRSCASKATIVAQDERESGCRALLNLGHTFGHALESEMNFSEILLHGEAVAIGMVLAAELSERLGHAPPGTAQNLAAHLRQSGLPTTPLDIFGDWNAARLLDHMHGDKKAEGESLTFILLRGIGQAFIAKDVPHQAVLATLSPYCKA